LIMFQQLNAKVEPPNYNFPIESLDAFFPGQKFADLGDKFGKGEVMSKVAGVETIKFHVKKERYNFPVLIQVQDGVILDFLARLPSYFLHDVFFQSLVNRYGKQKTYKKIGEEAFYVWNKKALKHVYSAACTITCFPVFYSVHKEDAEKS